MTLDKRKLKVLHAIIKNYVLTGEPVGSRTISKSYDLGVSSATIRNEMSDLEELGLLLQPYTSAGRVPSDKGYRLYVNNILPLLEEDMSEYDKISEDMDKKINHIEDLLKRAVKILSDSTNYTSVALAPQSTEDAIKNIQVVKLDEYRIMVIIILESGNVKNEIFRLNDDVEQEDILLINNFLNSRLKGQKVNESSIYREEDKRLLVQNPSINHIIPIVTGSINSEQEVELYFDGVANILNFPEYSDIEKVKQFLNFIQDKERVKNTLSDRDIENGLQVKIGSENLDEELKDCSIITAKYSLNGNTIGKIGVVGPTRMDYLKIMGIIKSVTEELNQIIKEHLTK